MNTQQEMFERAGNTFVPVVGRITLAAREHPMADLRGYPPAVNRPNSIAAADAFKPYLSRAEQVVYAFIVSQGAGGATDNECIDHAASLGWSRNGPRARRVALRDRGLVVQNGNRKGCAVWVVDSTTNKEAI